MVEDPLRDLVLAGPPHVLMVVEPGEYPVQHADPEGRPDRRSCRPMTIMCQRLVTGEQIARMYQEPGLAWLERQAEAAEALLSERQAGDQNQ